MYVNQSAVKGQKLGLCVQSLIFLSPRRVSPFLPWGDFHACSRFARSTIPEEKWRTTRSLAKIQRDDVCRFSAENLLMKNLAIPQSLTLQFPLNHVTYRRFTLPWDVGLYFMIPEWQESKIKVESYIYYKCFNFTIAFVTSKGVLKSSLTKIVYNKGNIIDNERLCDLQVGREKLNSVLLAQILD